MGSLYPTNLSKPLQKVMCVPNLKKVFEKLRTLELGFTYTGVPLVKCQTCVRDRVTGPFQTPYFGNVAIWGGIGFAYSILHVIHSYFTFFTSGRRLTIQNRSLILQMTVSSHRCTLSEIRLTYFQVVSIVEVGKLLIFMPSFVSPLPSLLEQSFKKSLNSVISTLP